MRYFVSEHSVKRVLMARSLAERWIQDQVRPEYRFTVFSNVRDVRGIPSVLRSFRDGKIRVGSVDPIPDLGVEEGFGQVTVWTSDRTSAILLCRWFEKHGFETTGVV